MEYQRCEPGQVNARNSKIARNQTTSNPPVLSPNTLLNCFVTHDAILQRMGSEFENLKQFSSWRKSHKIEASFKDSKLKKYLKLKPKKKRPSTHMNTKNPKLHVRSERGSSLNKIIPKRLSQIKEPNKKHKASRKKNSNAAHRISIETQFKGKNLWYECNTQQVSAIKIPSRLISDKKNCQSILKDSNTIETKKNLFPKISKTI